MVAVEAYISERFLTRKNGVRGYVEVATKKSGTVKSRSSSR